MIYLNWLGVCDKMSSVATDYKCPSCHAKLEFNPKDQNWKCEYCDSVFQLEDLKVNEEKYQEKEAKEEENDIGTYNVYKCSNCGAELVTDLNTTATFCVYCKNTAIIKERLVGKFEPKEIIPFSKTTVDATEAFKKIGKKHPLMPKSFSSVQNISEIRGVYIPFWLFSSVSNGGITASCEIRHMSHRRGDYVYTRVDDYEVIREGNIVFEKVPNDGAVKFDDDIMNSIEPFDYKKLVEFSPSYLSGFLAEKYDVSSEEAQEKAVKRMKNSALNFLRQQIPARYNRCVISSNSIGFENINLEYVLLPVYMLNIKYKNKVYTFAMNGESGKMIGNMPIDIKKAIKLFLLVFGITFFICWGVFYIFIRSNV